MKTFTISKSFFAWRIFACASLIFALAGPAFAEIKLEALAAGQEAKLSDAVQRLAQQRERLSQQELPLLQEIQKEQEETLRLRQEVASLRALRDGQSLSLESLQEKVASQSVELDYITGTLWGEYWAAYQAALSAGEQAEWGETLRQYFLEQEAISKTGSSATLSPEGLSASLNLLSQSGQRMLSLRGGKRYLGSAVMANGVLAQGEFIQMGPFLYFAHQGQVGWIVETTNQQARVVALPEEVSQQVGAWVAGQEDGLPLDLSSGDALRLAQTKESLLEHLAKGGFLVYPILFFALLSLLVALLKGVQVLRVRFPAAGVVPELVALLRKQEWAKAESLAQQQPEPCRAMLLQGVKHSNEPIELVEEVMYESLLHIQPRYEKFLQVIAVTAAVAPLLGLLGTVTGIIKTFKTMNVVGTGDSQALIGGISEALITTQLGLFLAIPALIVHAILTRRVAGVVAHVEKLGVSFVNGLSRKK